MQPFPVVRDLRRLQEESARQEKQGSCRDHHRVAGDVTRHHRANKHHVGVGGDEGGEEDEPEVEDAAVEAEDVARDRREREALDGEEGEVHDEGGDHVGGRAVGVVWGLADEDEPLLDEGGHRVVGWEEDEADGEDVEVEEAVDGDEAALVEVLEEGREDQSHHREDDLTG